ncbi:glycosyl transferase, group 1 [Flavobacteriaceae bacterium 3519-10]|nr:glycosyl transferase, group 1 [Flavobacteriaceae bacterium 3519-10]
MKNKVLIDLERLRYPRSGIATIFSHLAQGLESLPQSNIQLNLFAPSEPSNSGFPVLRWKKWSKLNPFLGQKFDLVHVSHQLSSYFHNKPKHQKKIVTLHDLNFLHENFSESKLKRNISRVNKNLQNADVVVCISEFVKQDYLKNQHLFKIQANQEVEVIYNGLKFPDTSKLFDLGEFEFLNNKKYFLNIGVLFPKKNQLSILKTMHLLDEDLVLVVSGSKKEYEAEVLKYIKDNHLENRVHILRDISDDQKHALIQHCEAMIHPSLAEGFGIPPIEAMHFGKPVFLSRLTSLPEIGGEQAFYFDDFEPLAMSQTIKNGMDTYRFDLKLAANLKSWAQQFDYRKMAQDYYSLYKKVLAIS